MKISFFHDIFSSWQSKDYPKDKKYVVTYLSVCIIQMLRLWKIIGMLVPLRPLITICVCVWGNMMHREIQQKSETIQIRYKYKYKYRCIQFETADYHLCRCMRKYDAQIDITNNKSCTVSVFLKQNIILITVLTHMKCKWNFYIEIEYQKQCSSLSKLCYLKQIHFDPVTAICMLGYHVHC